MKRAPGFTLLEIVVTVGILALLAAFTLPTYQLILSQIQLNSAVEQTADLTRLAEQKTVTEQSIYGVTFTVNATTIPMFLYNSVNSTKTTQSTLVLPTNISISQVNFSGNSDIRFATSGAPNFSGTVVLHDSIRNRNRVVEIRPSGNILSNTAEY